MRTFLLAIYAEWYSFTPPQRPNFLPPLTGGVGAPLNRPPSFTEGGATSRSVAENAVVGEYFGAPLAATDPDGDTLTYTLGGAGSRFFNVNPTTGRLGVKVPLDYETRSSHSVAVRVADGRGAAASIAVTVAVVNVGLEGMVGRYDTDDNGAIGRDEAHRGSRRLLRWRHQQGRGDSSHHGLLRRLIRWQPGSGAR